MWKKAFWKDTVERAIKTGAQAIVLGLGLAEGFNLFSMDVTAAAGFFGGGVVLSVLTSIISAPLSSRGTASLVEAVEYGDLYHTGGIVD